MNIFVARQPIFDDRDRVAGYELLYRKSGESTRAEGVSVHQMSSEVLIHAMLDIGMDRLTGGAPAFLNFSREQLVGGVYQLLDPASCVIELLESIAGDVDAAAACERLRTAGYRLALDDFSTGENQFPLLPFAEIVKIDVLDRPLAEVAEQVAELAPFGKRLLAERVENLAVHSDCKKLGFTLFQGYYYSWPETLSNTDIPVGQINVIRLLNLLKDPSAADRKVVDTFQTDLALSYKLLRIVNSAAFGGRGIESIQHAMLLIGRDALYRWLSLLLVSSLATQRGTDGELVHAAIFRARMCEMLAGAAGRSSAADSHFLVGLFSRLDVLLKVPMAAILARVDLATDVRLALLERTGPYSTALKLVEAYEDVRWDTVCELAAELGVAADAIPPIYVEALTWAKDRLQAAES